MGERKKEKVEEEPTEVMEVSPSPISKEMKKRWPYFIQKVYETDPLICPKWALALPLQRSTTGRRFFTPSAGKSMPKTQFISSLIESWGSKTEQTQAQSGSEL